MDDVLLIVGGTSMRSRPDQARYIYTGTQFRVARSVADFSERPWAIVDAKFGLVWPTDLIQPHTVSLSTFSRAQKDLWARSISSALARKFEPTTTRVIFIGTSLYMEPAKPAFEKAGFTVWLPWWAKDMQQQMSELTKLRRYFKAPATP